MTTSLTPSIPQPQLGGLSLTWYLADEPRAITTKDGKDMTVLELRDPRRLANSLVIWLDGLMSPPLQQVLPNTLISVHVESVRSGRARGELVARASREAVEAAFARAAAERTQ